MRTVSTRGATTSPLETVELVVGLVVRWAAAVDTETSVSAAAIPNFETIRVIGLLPLCHPFYSPPRMASGLCTGSAAATSSRYIERRRSSRHRPTLKHAVCRRVRVARSGGGEIRPLFIREIRATFRLQIARHSTA